MLLNKIPTPFRAQIATTIYRAGLIGGAVTALLTGFLAVRNDVGHFAEDPGYLIGYAFAIFFLITVPCFVAAVFAEKISDNIHRVRNTSKEELRKQACEPRKLFILTRIVAGVGVIAGSTVALLAGDAAMWHNPQRAISDDPIYFFLIMFSWFAVCGGPVLLFAGAIEIIYRLVRKRRSR